MSTVAFRLDGGLSDDRRRRVLLPELGSPPAAYLPYYAEACHDTALHHDVVERHRAQGDHLVFVCERPEVMRRETEAWLQRAYGQMDSWSLLMAGEEPPVECLELCSPDALADMLAVMMRDGGNPATYADLIRAMRLL